MARSISDARRAPAADEKPWGFWASLAWVGLALILNDRFPRLKHALLDGTQAGSSITHSLALGAAPMLSEVRLPFVSDVPRAPSSNIGFRVARALLIP